MKFQEFKKIPRLSRDMVITEKIDGTNAQIAILDVTLENRQDVYSGLGGAALGCIEVPYNGADYVIVAGSRTRWISTVQDNHGFARWVTDNASELVKLGTGNHYGEWWGQGIQRGYDLKEKKFSLFNVSRWGDPAARPECCDVVPTICTGVFDTEIVEMALNNLIDNGSMAAPGFMKPEGIVIYHTANGYMFKKTIEKDESPKSLVKEVQMFAVVRTINDISINGDEYLIDKKGEN